MKKSPVLAVLALSCILAVPAFAAQSHEAMIDAKLNAPLKGAILDASANDGKAVVYEIKGKAVRTSQGSPVEKNLKVGDVIQAGDTVYTEKGANLSLSFDNHKKNAVRIPEGSKAVFTSIEPTDIKLENGSIFSVVNGLAEGSTWKVTTPSAVAAVRGTVYVVKYETASGQFYAATVNVPDDGKSSAIEIKALNGEGNAEIPEGKEIILKQGEAPSQDLVQDLTPEQIAEIQNFFQELSSGNTNSDDLGLGDNTQEKVDDQSEAPGGADLDQGETNPNAFMDDKKEEEKPKDDGQHYLGCGTNCS